MGRPTDHYTHDQFVNLDGSHSLDGKVRCRHCRQWTGAGRTLNRKKDHLSSCEAYASWRAAGNGQDMPPANPYNSSKRVTEPVDVSDNSFGYLVDPEVAFARSRQKIPDLTSFFLEHEDENDEVKCLRVQCKYCDLQRAKNPPRQYMHLKTCSNFLATVEGQQFMTELSAPTYAGSAGSATNSTFKATPRMSTGPRTVSQNRPSANLKPSLINFLLGRTQEALQDAIQRPFLSHAGCGTLSAVAVEHFLTQQDHVSCAFPSFIGRMIGKIRLPTVRNPQEDTEWRTFDLLVSTLNNAKRELEFLRTMRDKYGLQTQTESPRHAANGLVDLMESATSPAASLLEGMVVLWAIEYLLHESWHYAARYQQPEAPSATSYSLPTYLQSNSGSNPFDAQRPRFTGDTAPHTTAISESLIPNWTSAGFSKFVDACKAIVDELANSQTTGNGARELTNTERMFSQTVWLWKSFWPEVTGMGEEEESNAMDTSEPGANGANSSNPIDLGADGDEENGDGDDDAPTAETPFGGLRAIAAANLAG